MSLFSGIIVEKKKVHYLICSAILALASGIQLHKLSGKLTTLSELNLMLPLLLFNVYYPQRPFNRVPIVDVFLFLSLFNKNFKAVLNIKDN